MRQGLMILFCLAFSHTGCVSEGDLNLGYADDQTPQTTDAGALDLAHRVGNPGPTGQTGGASADLRMSGQDQTGNPTECILHEPPTPCTVNNYWQNTGCGPVGCPLKCCPLTAKLNTLGCVLAQDGCPYNLP